jgi:hypothetical protein
LGSYADQIAKLKLVKLLEKSGGRDDVSETDVKKLHASVLEAADIAGPLLERIPVTFKQYTEHNLGHSKNLIVLMGKLIPEKTQKTLNALEIAVLLLAAMLHDIGMFVSDEERNEFLASKEFERFLNAVPEKEQAIADARVAGKHVTVRVIEDAVLADYFRKFHPERARLHIEQHLGEVLRFREYSLVDVVSRICESHGWGVFETTDPRHTEKTIANLKADAAMYDVPFNEQYIAAMLRLADIMDFDRSRTPLSVLKTIDFTEAKSQAEWQKHLQIKGWKVTERDVVFHAECRKTEHYVAVMEFLEWIDAELRDCRRLLVRNAPKEIAERYPLHLPPAVDRMHVEMADKSFIAGAFRFELDYERIMNLLMDRSLYPDPSLFLRELLQNSLDACRVRTAEAQYEGAPDKYQPRITAWDRSKDANPTIVFQDNGVGMSRGTVEKYFMRVGRSYYRSNEFHAERKRLLERNVELEATSQFGIGFLSCFMVADRIVIETYRKDHDALRIEIEGATKYFTLQVMDAPSRPQFLSQGMTADEDGPPMFPGTRITLYLRPNQRIDVRQTLETFGVNIEAPVTIVGNETSTLPVYGWRRDPLTRIPNFGVAHPNWSEVLTIIEVPVEKYDFCNGLDGRAWFWVLRGADGAPSVRNQFLEVSNELNIRGIAGMTGRFVIMQPTQNPEELAGEMLGSFWTEAPQILRARILAHARGASNIWSRVEGSLATLLRGGDDWLDVRAAYGNFGLSLSAPQRLALHGIALPAGVTRWDPMRGSGSQLYLLSFAAGFEVDVRQRVPRPAANRLFLSPRDADRVFVPLLRAYIRRAMEVWDENEGSSDWRWWVEEFVGCLRTDQRWFVSVMREEHPHIERRLQYRVQTPEGNLRVTMDELRSRFGRWAPLAEVEHPKGLPSFLEKNAVNRVLLYNRPTEMRDGIEMVDLHSEADPEVRDD